MSDETLPALQMCGHCRYFRHGAGPMGLCTADIDLPECITRFLPQVGMGTVLSVDFAHDGSTCGVYERKS